MPGTMLTSSLIILSINFIALEATLSLTVGIGLLLQCYHYSMFILLFIVNIKCHFYF